MKKIGVFTNLKRDINLEYTNQIIHWIIKNGCRPIITKLIADKLHFGEYASDFKGILESSDFFVVLGGDGTILRIARHSSLYEKPLIGINLGTLGYLTDVERGEGFSALSNVLEGNYKLENRMMIEASFKDENDIDHSFIALNDGCITKSLQSKMIRIEIYINDEYIDTYRSDGVIISTPTGSTAYNLSAGGPILKPDAHMIAITPICPHSLYVRSSVISENDIIKVKIIDNNFIDVVLSLDGQNRFMFKNGGLITFKRSKYNATIIRTNNNSFYDVLRRKMALV